MKLRRVWGWIAGLILLVFAVLTLWTGNIAFFVILAVLIILIFPPLYCFFRQITGAVFISRWRIAVILCVVLAGSVILYLQKSSRDSIYKSPAARERIMEFYDTRMSEWFTPYESLYISTRYGDVHIIESGERQKPPLILLPGTQMAAWSWIYNIVNLNNHFHTYALDFVGDTGKSQLEELTAYPITDADIQQHFNEILAKLKINSASFIGASGGGHLALRYAMTEPERVEKVVLIAPLGFTPLIRIITQMVWAQLFPIKPVISPTIKRVFGDSPVVGNLCHEWFYETLQGVSPQIAPPRLFTPYELKRIKTPVLLILGSDDKIAGNPEKVINRAVNLPEVQIRVLESAHLVNVEKSGEVNQLINKFLKN